MAKQTFTTGQVLTAAQMTSLQQTAMGGGSATAKTASYTLVAADAGGTVIMNSASATTITINTSLFSAGDTVFIQNIGAGVSTITAGTATVNTASSLALAQYESGNLYFTAAGASIFSKADGAAAGGGKVLQVVSATITTATTIAATSLTDTNITATITPTSASSKVLIIITGNVRYTRDGNNLGVGADLVRGATTILNFNADQSNLDFIQINGGSLTQHIVNTGITYLDSPATTSATTYKVRAQINTTANSGTSTWQYSNTPSVITLLEIGA